MKFENIRITEDESHNGLVDGVIENETLILTGTSTQLKMTARMMGELTGIIPKLNFCINVPIDIIKNIFDEYKTNYLYVQIHQKDEDAWISIRDKLGNQTNIRKPDIELRQYICSTDFYINGLPKLPDFMLNTNILCIDKNKCDFLNKSHTIFQMSYPLRSNESDCINVVCDNFAMGKKIN
jgi:hypothetical protein